MKPAQTQIIKDADDQGELKLLDNEAVDVPFFSDFIFFLKYLENQPIKKTATGNISLADIERLRPNLLTVQENLKIFEEMGWQVRTEGQVHPLSDIKVLAKIMYLTYNRKGQLLLSKNGKGFLYNIGPLSQYWNLVLTYWHEANWEYFSPSTAIKGVSLAQVLQRNQKVVWNMLIHKGKNWIDFKVFCQMLKTGLQLGDYFDKSNFGYYYEKGMEDYELYSDLSFILFNRNLMRFGCVEVREEIKEYGIKRIVAFRSTKIGPYLFEKDLEGYW